MRLIKVRYLPSDYAGRSGLSALHSAASNGDIARARDAIEGGVDVDAREPTEGQTPLILAVRHMVRLPKSTEDQVCSMVTMLLEHGADPSAADNDGLTPLHWAAASQLAKVARVLIEAGADVNARDKLSITPLHQCASSPRLEIPRLLLQAGADVNARGPQGATPLAIAEGNVVIRSDGKDVYEDLRSLLRKHGAVR